MKKLLFSVFLLSVCGAAIGSVQMSAMVCKPTVVGALSITLVVVSGKPLMAPMGQLAKSKVNLKYPLQGFVLAKRTSDNGDQVYSAGDKLELDIFGVQSHDLPVGKKRGQLTLDDGRPMAVMCTDQTDKEDSDR